MGITAIVCPYTPDNDNIALKLLAPKKVAFIAGADLYNDYLQQTVDDDDEAKKWVCELCMILEIRFNYPPIPVVAFYFLFDDITLETSASGLI